MKAPTAAASMAVTNVSALSMSFVTITSVLYLLSVASGLRHGKSYDPAALARAASSGDVRVSSAPPRTSVGTSGSGPSASSSVRPT